MCMIRAWKKLASLVADLMRQGMTVEKVALTLGIGLGISVFPIVGIPTLLCTAAAVCFRLNFPLIQAVNYAGTPLQWLLILPFLRLGEMLTGTEPLPLSPAQIRSAIEVQGLGFFSEFIGAALCASLGWLVVCPLLAGLTYVALRVARPAAGRTGRSRAAPVSPAS